MDLHLQAQYVFSVLVAFNNYCQLSTKCTQPVRVTVRLGAACSVVRYVFRLDGQTVGFTDKLC